MMTEAQENRADLVTLLRDRSKWPSDFEWNFLRPECCAIGLARESGVLPDESRFSDALGLTDKQATDVFVYPRGLKFKDWDKYCATITPEVVADKLESMPFVGEDNA